MPEASDWSRLKCCPPYLCRTVQARTDAFVQLDQRSTLRTARFSSVTPLFRATDGNETCAGLRIPPATRRGVVQGLGRRRNPLCLRGSDARRAMHGIPSLRLESRSAWAALSAWS
jgi:hypothetical protein